MSDKPEVSKPPRIVKCPRCGTGVAWSTENRYRPFCSERCRQIDLGAWANEEYRVAGSEPVEDDPDGMSRA